MELGDKDKLILLQNLMNRATDIAIAKYGKDVDADKVDAILTDVAKNIFARIEKIGK